MKDSDRPTDRVSSIKFLIRHLLVYLLTYGEVDVPRGSRTSVKDPNDPGPSPTRETVCSFDSGSLQFLGRYASPTVPCRTVRTVEQGEPSQDGMVCKDPSSVSLGPWSNTVGERSDRAVVNRPWEGGLVQSGTAEETVRSRDPGWTEVGTSRLSSLEEKRVGESWEGFRRHKESEEGRSPRRGRERSGENRRDR